MITVIYKMHKLKKKFKYNKKNPYSFHFVTNNLNSKLWLNSMHVTANIQKITTGTFFTNTASYAYSLVTVYCNVAAMERKYRFSFYNIGNAESSFMKISKHGVVKNGK